ncbi:MAG: hypothetical protein ACK4MS_13480 [Paracoccaceae bacterium]
MTDKTDLSRFQTIAAQEIAAHDLGGRPAPFISTEWVASSLLQKAIRRGNLYAARQAGRFFAGGQKGTPFPPFERHRRRGYRLG